MTAKEPDEYFLRVSETLAVLGIPPELIEQRGLALCREPHELVVAAIDEDGREHRLISAAEEAWRKMSAAAKAEGEPMQIVSAFRSVERQAEIVRRKLAEGL